MGYPGIAMTFFLVAAAMAVAMLWAILTGDRH
jgi:hypothetical protein